MDSVTQIALGAAVGEAVLGSKIGRRAMLWGAICGTLPDLDILLPLGDPVRDFTYHRSASHSIFVLAAITPLIVWLILKLHPQTVEWRRRWHALVFLTFATHILLDCFTVYGTQILWPIWNTPVTWSTIFIIDPLYTLPLLIGVFGALFMRRKPDRASRLNRIGLTLSSLYLTWTVAAKLHVESVAREGLAEMGIEDAQLLTTPSPFNTLLWRGLAVDRDNYYEGYYSLLDPRREVRFTHFPRNPELLEGLEEHWPVRRLAWFTKGFYSTELAGNDIAITDLRMGSTPHFVFRFKVGELSNPHGKPTPAEKLLTRIDYSQLNWIWKRIWAADA